AGKCGNDSLSIWVKWCLDRPPYWKTHDCLGNAIVSVAKLGQIYVSIKSPRQTIVKPKKSPRLLPRAVGTRPFCAWAQRCSASAMPEPGGDAASSVSPPVFAPFWAWAKGLRLKPEAVRGLRSQPAVRSAGRAPPPLLRPAG